MARTRKSIPLARIAQRLFDTPLAIAESKFEILVNYLGPRLGIGLDPTAEIEIGDLDPHALNVGGIMRPDGTILAFDDDDDDSFSSSSPSSTKKPYTVTDDGVAIIKVAGTLTEKSAWYHAYSGMTSYESIGKQVAECDADNNIRAILLNCNTPGGETHGLFDLCDALYSRRGKKPMHGIAKNAALSAGYAIISCCDRVTVTRTGALGSIGVFCGHVDQSGLDQKIGLKFSYIHAGKKKVDGNPHEPLSKSARSDAQNEVDREYEMFVNLVSRNRNCSADDVRSTEAGVLFAENTMPLLGDAVGTLDDAYLAVVQKSGIVIPMGRETKQAANVSTQTELKAGNKPTVQERVAAMSPAEALQLHGQLVAVEGAGITPEFLGLLEARGKEVVAPAATAPVTAPVEVPVVPPVVEPAASAPAPSDDNDEDDTDPKAGKNNKSGSGCDPENEDDMPEANAPMTTKIELSKEQMLHIVGICKLAGKSDMAQKFLADGLTPEKVTEALQELRADEANNPDKQISSHAPNMATSAFDKMMNAVAAQEAKGLSHPEAFSAVFKADPSLYRAYNEEKEDNTSMPSTRRKYGAMLIQKLSAISRGEVSEILMSRNDPTVGNGMRA